MASFPASNAYTENGIDRGTLRQRMTDDMWATRQLVGAGTVQALTIASGSITPASGASGSIVIDTEAAASSDDLANISTANLPDGSHILIRIADNGRVVNVLDMAGGAGQIALEGGLDLQLNLVGQWLELRRDGTDWTEVRRGGREKEHRVGDAGEPAFQGAWGGGIVVAFWKDPDGVVHMSGRANNAALPSPNTVIFSLPALYRPSTTRFFAGPHRYNTVADAEFQVHIEAPGDVRFDAPGIVAGGTASVVFDGISFRAEQ